jgi:hypothetical protein
MEMEGGKLVNKLVSFVLLALAVGFISFGASAQLVPTSYGFPTILQTSNTVAYSQNTANALNYQNVNVNFPTDLGCSTGVDMAFPDISQTSLQTQSQTQTQYTQTNSYSEFSYPFVGIGTGLAGFSL